jgi:hypothetical protein
MPGPLSQIKVARDELALCDKLSDYESVDVAWVAMVKAANTRPEPNEHRRLVAVLDQVNATVVHEILFHPGVDVLLNLQPPLETILTSPHERLDAERTKREMSVIRQLRESDPKGALRALAEIIKRIRNRRAHGFKTPYAPRDQEILGAAAPVLRAMAMATIDVVST